MLGNSALKWKLCKSLRKRLIYNPEIIKCRSFDVEFPDAPGTWP